MAPGGLTVFVLVTLALAGVWAPAGDAAESAERQFRAALQMAGSGDFAGAERSLRQLERSHPQEFEIRYRLGLVLLRLEKHSEAIPRLEAAVQLRPGDAQPWVALARGRLQAGLRQSALEAARKAAERAREPQAYRALAMFYADANEFSAAAEFEERWGNASAGDAEARERAASLHLRAAEAYRASRDAAKAVDAYQNAIRLSPENRQAYFLLATLFLEHRTPQPALAVLDVAAARFHSEAEYQRLRGLALYQTGDVPKAMEAFLRSADLAPESEVSYASFETLLADAGPRLPEIEARLRRFRERRPDSPVGHFLLGKVLQVQQAPGSETRPLFESALRAEPRFWPAHYELGQLLAGEQQWEKAADALLQVVKLNGEYPPAHYALARVYSAMADRERALAHRKIHHELLQKQRELAEKQRAAAPALVYRMEGASR